MKVTQKMKDEIKSEFPVLVEKLGVPMAKKELMRKYNVSDITVYRLVCFMIPKKESKKHKETKFYNSREFVGSMMVPEAYKNRPADHNLSRVPIKNWDELYNMSVNLK